MGLVSEDLSALMASAVFLVTPAAGDYMEVSLLSAQTRAQPGFNSHCCEDR